MLEKIINIFKRLFRFNSVKYLQTPSFAEGGYGMENNFNVITTLEDDSSEKSNIQFEKIEIQENKHPIEQAEIQIESQIENKDKVLDCDDLISYVLNDNDEFEDETKFEYDESKVEEMNQKIDYYKKNPDELYLLSLNEMLEINFYYEKRIEKLENLNA